MPNQIYALPELPYDPAALEPHISGRIIELHYLKHHAAYVKGANATLEQLRERRTQRDFTMMAALEKSLAFHVSGHVLHSLLWSNMSPDGGGDPSGPLASELERTFGSVNMFRDQMVQAAGTIQGSGWALASWEPTGSRVVVQQVYDHEGNHGQGTIPLLAIDAWEHAYYLQYENRKAEYFTAFWNVVNWDDAGRRYELAGVPPSSRRRNEWQYDDLLCADTRKEITVTNAIVVGVDGTPSSNAAVEWAAELARKTEATVLAVHVVPSAWEWEMAALQVNTEPQIRARRRDLLGRWTEPFRDAGVPHTTHLLEGNPGKELLRLAEQKDADLIVIGGKPHGRVRDLVYGGTRHQIVTDAPCPVVVVPAQSKDRQSPEDPFAKRVHAAPVRIL